MRGVLSRTVPGDRISQVPNDGKPIGIAVSAYSEFLCVCSVTFEDSSYAPLDCYINFSEYTRDDS